MAFLVCLFKLSLAKATNMKRKAVFVSVLQIRSTGEKRYNGYAAKKGLRIFTSMRDYLATEEESFLSLMFQSYCNFTIAFINTRYVLLPHRTPPPLPSKYHGSHNPAKTARGNRTCSPSPPVGNSTILLQFHYRFPVSSWSCSSRLTSCGSWNTKNQSLYLANRRNVKPSWISLSKQTMSTEILGIKCVT